MLGHADRRVAIVLPSLLPLGGAERVAINLAFDFIARGVAVDIVLLNEPHDVTGAVPPEARIFKLATPRTRKALWPLVCYLRQERPDAVLASMWPVTVITVVANALAGSPSRVVVSDHIVLSIQYAGWGRLHNFALRASICSAYRFAAARVAVSNGVAADVARLAGMPKYRFEVIYNPISLPDSTEMGRRQAESMWQCRRGNRILSVGRLKPQKNHKLLIKAFERLRDTREARLIILGTGELETELREYIEAHGLTGEVVLAGHVSDMTAWYESADLFVLSSDYEGFGNVIVEALACGLPVVSTDCKSGPAEILENGRYGRLVPVGDVDALTRAMAEVLTTDFDREVLRRRAPDFAPGVAAGKYLDLLFPSEE